MTPLEDDPLEQAGFRTGTIQSIRAWGLRPARSWLYADEPVRNIESREQNLSHDENFLSASGSRKVLLVVLTCSPGPLREVYDRADQNASHQNATGSVLSPVAQEFEPGAEARTCRRVAL